MTSEEFTQAILAFGENVDGALDYIFSTIENNYLQPGPTGYVEPKFAELMILLSGVDVDKFSTPIQLGFLGSVFLAHKNLYPTYQTVHQRIHDSLSKRYRPTKVKELMAGL